MSAEEKIDFGPPIPLDAMTDADFSLAASAPTTVDQIPDEHFALAPSELEVEPVAAIESLDPPAVPVDAYPVAPAPTRDTLRTAYHRARQNRSAREVREPAAVRAARRFAENQSRHGRQLDLA